MTNSLLLLKTSVEHLFNYPFILMGRLFAADEEIFSKHTRWSCFGVAGSIIIDLIKGTGKASKNLLR